LATALFLWVIAPPACAELPAALVYTRNHVTGGGGYVHDNIAASVEMLRQLGERGGFTIEATDDPAVFTDDNLKKYRLLIFSNSNNEAFENDDQREVFRRFIQAGGGFVGIHCASASERQWPYYWAVVGGKFRSHPKLQPFTLHVVDKTHPATAHLGDRWEWEDEFYFSDNLNPGIRVLLAGDLSTLDAPDKGRYPGVVFGDRFPLAWCQEFDGGRQFYTALGHKIEYYSDPKFQQHVLGGILWCLKSAPTP
jgi:type 1 glutamine amidotransferase